MIHRAVAALTPLSPRSSRARAFGADVRGDKQRSRGKTVVLMHEK
jgi:hypothetical protein